MSNFTYSAAFGTTTQAKDPNLLATNYTYDTFGRLASASPPDTTKTTVTYSYCSGINRETATCPTNGAFLATSTPLGTDGVTQVGPQTITYFDALLRVIATDTQGFSGGLVRQDTQYTPNSASIRLTGRTSCRRRAKVDRQHQ